MLDLARAIDRFTERSAIVFAWLLAPLLLAVTWEVVARYLFGAPTRWAYEAIYMAYAALFMLGAAYGLRAGAHVRTDFLWQKWRPRTRAAIDIVAYAALFFPGMLAFLVAGAEATWDSWRMGERSADTSWMPPLWPLKALVPLSSLLLILQGLSEFLKSLHAFRHER
ncbi:MAG TPA: TRAP transporter small permease subunit [Burkholderiales bacterium]|nr:TRAP transporter small permease subunit [Burkholderiales bacterium]